MGISAMPRIYHIETVPFTGRAHIVVRFRQVVRSLTEFRFLGFKKEHASLILPENHESSIRVNQILSKIVRAIGSILAIQTEEPIGWAAALDWEAIVLQDDDIRARCWDGAGKIVVYTGLLDHISTDEEIAAVLAHEVGHVIGRHSSEMIGMFANWKWFPNFLLTPLFRRREFEADYIGMILLAASGFDPHIAPHTLEKFGKIGKEYISKNIFYPLVCTHPSPDKRSRFLLRPKAREKAMELYKQVTSACEGSNKA